MKTLDRREQGFTIIELIVVIIVIAVLVAISTISYNLIVEKAREQEVASSVQNVASKLTSYKASSGGYPSSLSPLNLEAGEVTFNYAYNVHSNSYCLSGTLKTKVVSVRSNALEPRAGGC